MTHFKGVISGHLEKLDIICFFSEILTVFNRDSNAIFQKQVQLCHIDPKLQRQF